MHLSLPLCVLLLAAGACEAADEPAFFGRGDPAALEAAARPLSEVSVVEGTAEVTVSGTITTVCETMGCWFYLAGDDSMVFVDLEQGKDFTIPIDAKGRRAVVAGTLHADGGDRRLRARAVLLRPR